jgi:hypothetical protein
MNGRYLLVALPLFLSMATPSALAETDEGEPGKSGEEAWQNANQDDGKTPQAKEDTLEEEEEYKNAFIFGFSHILHLTRDRDTPIGNAIGHRENLLGTFFAFERILHPHVSITFVKPFYFNKERLDSPFEILINGLYRKNKWEPFIAAGMLSVLRVFYSERDENGVAEKEFAFGLRFVAGFKYFVTPHWAVSFELGYTFIPGSTTIEHEISDSYLGAYFF